MYLFAFLSEEIINIDESEIGSDSSVKEEDGSGSGDFRKYLVLEILVPRDIHEIKNLVKSNSLTAFWIG